MDVKKFRKKYKLTNSDMIRIISYKYTKFGKYALYMCANPQDYGVQLTPEAENTLYAAVDKKKANRKKNHQLTVRVDDGVFDLVKYICDERGMTVQDWIEETIIKRLTLGELIK